MLKSLLLAFSVLIPMSSNVDLIYNSDTKKNELIAVGVGAETQSSDYSDLLAQEIPAIQEEGFVFDFLGCVSTPNTDIPLTCNFLVENSQESEKRLRIYGNLSSSYYSRVIDASGNEIIASSVELGSASGSGYATLDLPSGIPLQASFNFSQAPEGAIRILDIRALGNSTFDVEFRFPR